MITVGEDGGSLNADVGVVCVCMGPELTGPLLGFWGKDEVNGALHWRQADRSSGFGVPHFRQYIVSPQKQGILKFTLSSRNPAHYHRINTAPQVTPAPKADIITTS